MMAALKVHKGSIVTVAIVTGILLYLSKFLRPYFNGNHYVLFILGFLPNLGLSFALPFIYVANRIRLHKPVEHFVVACVVTLFLMVLNEIRDQYQAGRVFDWYDIFGSFAGILFAYLLFHFVLKASRQ